MRPDETVAWDDALVERYPWCIECLRPARHLDLLIMHGLVMTVSRCGRCFGQDREAVQLIARLAARAQGALV